MIRNFSDHQIIMNKNKKSIFLAGPTLRKQTFEQSWRKHACEILEKNGFEGIVYIPEFEQGNNPVEFLQQAEWEREGLLNADIIAFYIPRKLPELPGFTTNVEFGMYLAKRPEAVRLCIPKDSVKNRYLEWLFVKENPSRTIDTDLEEFLLKILQEFDS